MTLLLVGMTAEAVQVNGVLLANVAFDPVTEDGKAPDVPEEAAPLEPEFGGDVKVEVGRPLRGGDGRPEIEMLLNTEPDCDGNGIGKGALPEAVNPEVAGRGATVWVTVTMTGGAVSSHPLLAGGCGPP